MVTKIYKTQNNSHGGYIEVRVKNNNKQTVVEYKCYEEKLNEIQGNNSNFREWRSEKTSDEAAQWQALSMWEMSLLESKSNASTWWLFMDRNSRVHNKVDLETIGFSLASEVLGLNDMIQRWIQKTERWYIFLFIVIISLKNVKILHYKYYRDCFIMSPGRQFLHTLGEKHFLGNWELGY